VNLNEKKQLEEALQKVNKSEYKNLVSPLTKENIKHKILEETARQIAQGNISSHEQIKQYILNKDREYAENNDKFKLILKIAPIALILFIIFIFLYQSFYL
jgi:hypothetical protein